MSERNLVITVKTLFGLEEILDKEIQALGMRNTKVLNRAVQLTGSWEDVYRLNLMCRVALSVLVKIEEFNIKDEKDLYDKCAKIDWTKYFGVEKTFAVKGSVHSTLFNHTQFPMLVVKDAVVDVFRDKTTLRPDVELKAPDVIFDVYIQERKVTLSINTSGAPLFQRGYRSEVGEAPLNEVLAAGMLYQSKWDKKSALIDPFCGSGTLVIEAAMMAGNIPPQLNRDKYCFQNINGYESETWKRVLDSVNKDANTDCKLTASDKFGEMILIARKNAAKAGVSHLIDFEVSDFSGMKKPAEKGLLICNPPYGERMGENIEKLYAELGDWFKNEMTGYSCFVISSNFDAFKYIGLKADNKTKLFNGSLECSFREYTIYEGSKKDKSGKVFSDKPRQDFSELKAKREAKREEILEQKRLEKRFTRPRINSGMSAIDKIKRERAIAENPELAEQFAKEDAPKEPKPEPRIIKFNESETISLEDEQELIDSLKPKAKPEMVDPEKEEKKEIKEEPKEVKSQVKNEDKAPEEKPRTKYDAVVENAYTKVSETKDPAKEKAIEEKPAKKVEDTKEEPKKEDTESKPKTGVSKYGAPTGSKYEIRND